MAELKIDGLVVTPTTAQLAIRDGREWAALPSSLARDKSSSQIDVPAAKTWDTSN